VAEGKLVSSSGSIFLFEWSHISEQIRVDWLLLRAPLRITFPVRTKLDP
jgi:hypothetical protein